MSEVVIDLRSMQVWEGGAGLLSWVAYPSDELKRHRYFTGLGQAIAKFDPAADFHGGCDRWGISDELRDTPYSRAREWARMGSKKIATRVVAGLIALPMVCELRFGEPATLVSGVERLSLDQLSAYYRLLTNESDPENVEKRTLRWSRPVLHLAASFAHYQRLAQRELGRRGDPLELLVHEDALRNVVGHAELLVVPLAQVTRLDPESDIRVRIIG